MKFIGKLRRTLWISTRDFPQIEQITTKNTFSEMIQLESEQCVLQSDADMFIQSTKNLIVRHGKGEGFCTRC